jgi:tetratricopeptide (TPR) repeat protein
MVAQVSVARRAEVAARKARYAIAVGDFSGAIAAAQSAVRLAQAVQDVDSIAAGHLHWGHALRRQSDYQAAGRQFERALALAEPMSQVTASSLRGLGLVCLNQVNYAKSQRFFEQALHICRQTGRRREEGVLLRDLGTAYMCQGDYGRARDHVKQALLICHHTGDRPEEGWTQLVLGALTTAQGHYAEGREDYEKALLTFREIGDRQGEGVTLCNLGVAYGLQGDTVAARASHEQALSIFGEIGDQMMVSTGLAYLGLLAHIRGDDRTARDKSQQALRIVQGLDSRAAQGLALTVLGHALVGLRNLAEATDVYEQALLLRRELDQHYLTAEPLAGLARVALTREDRIQALAHVETILDQLKTRPTLDGTDEPLRVYLTCYLVLRANHDPRAREILDAAYRLLQERATHIDDEELRRSFLENVAAHREIARAWQEAAYRASEPVGATVTC